MEGSDKMYTEKVDIGGGVIKDIASGLRQHVSLDTMQGAMVCVLTNLRPRKIQKVFESQGMVLAAETEDRESVIELLAPPEGSEPGDEISVDGFERKPENLLHKDKKKNAWMLEADKFKIDANGIANYDGHVIRTAKGEVHAPTVKNGVIA